MHNIIGSEDTLSCIKTRRWFAATAALNSCLPPASRRFYAEKGFQNEPTRCKECRAARKANRASAPREMYETTCAACGKPTTVPFIPKSDRPIYCSECFAAHRQA